MFIDEDILGIVIAGRTVMAERKMATFSNAGFTFLLVST